MSTRRECQDDHGQRDDERFVGKKRQAIWLRRRLAGERKIPDEIHVREHQAERHWRCECRRDDAFEAVCTHVRQEPEIEMRLKEVAGQLIPLAGNGDRPLFQRRQSPKKGPVPFSMRHHASLMTPRISRATSR